MLLFSNGNIFIHWKTKRRCKCISYNDLISPSLSSLKPRCAALTSALHRELSWTAPVSNNAGTEGKVRKTSHQTKYVFSLSLNGPWYPIQFFWKTASGISELHQNCRHDCVSCFLGCVFILWSVFYWLVGGDFFNRLKVVVFLRKNIPRHNSYLRILPES